jgi:hypothetical protein
MITKKTVFILGAGASVPYGFPTGKGLRALICENFVNKIRSLAAKENDRPAYIDYTGNEAENFVHAFLKSSTRCIDLFLARNPRLSEQGKIAIVLNILEAEQKSTFREAMGPEKEKEDWYFYLFNRMTEKLTDAEGYKQFSGNKVSFVTFNYDRSLEHFLWESLTNSFLFAPRDKIIEQIKKIPIFHVYGALGGGLAWDRPSLSYGPDFGISLVDELSKNLRTIYETEKEAEFSKAQEQISNAEQVFFLGFGYAEENCDVLQLDRVIRGNQEIYGTALGYFENEINKARTLLQKGFDSKEADRQFARYPIIESADCVELLRRYL